MTAPWVYDRTGFPYLVVPAAGVAVGLLPVLKAQAELYLGDPAGPGDDWYDEVLAVGPRAGWRTVGAAPVRLILTGISAEEAVRLAGWVGPGYRLPDVREWRAADAALGGLSSADLDAAAAGPACHPAVAGVLARLREAGRATVAELALLDGGALEWVTRADPPPGALGRPAAVLAPGLILNPQAFDPVVLIRPGRHPAYGVRLVRPLAPGEARP